MCRIMFAGQLQIIYYFQIIHTSTIEFNTFMLCVCGMFNLEM